MSCTQHHPRSISRCHPSRPQLSASMLRGRNRNKTNFAKSDAIPTLVELLASSLGAMLALDRLLHLPSVTACYSSISRFQLLWSSLPPID